MESENKYKNVGFSVILWTVLVVLMCALPCMGGTVNSDDFLEISSLYSDTLYVYGTVNIKHGGSVTGGLYAYNGSEVKITGGTVSPFISVENGANVTVIGTGFNVTNGSITDDPTETYFTVAYIFLEANLTGTYGGEGGVIYLAFYAENVNVRIYLAEPLENYSPVPDAGPDLTVFTKDIASTVINGVATDPDVADSLQYHWIEGAVEFTSWAPVGTSGGAPLDLGIILPQYLGVGTHTLTFEVTDGKETVSDDMVLTIMIAPIVIDIKPGSYPNSINLGSNGVIPVAILSTDEPYFDATFISADTVFLAGSGVAVRGKGSKLLAHKEDVNGDDILDLVVQVETHNLDPGTFQNGGAFLQILDTSDPENPIVVYEGWDEITIVPLE